MDLTNEFRVEEFERIVTSALDPYSPDHKQAQMSLVQFKESPNSWNHINTILSTSQNTQAHFIALQVLEQTIKSKWNVFSTEQKESLRNFIIQQILARAKEGNQNILLEKFNMSLVEILMRDWPRRWPTFIPDIVNASQSSGMNVCANSLCILKRLNDDIFVFSDITTVRKRMLTMQMKKEFIYIFNLINSVLEWAKTANVEEKLMLAIFNALESFVVWMPISFLCESNIVENVCFFINSRYCLSVLKCLGKIVDQRSFNEANDRNLAVVHYENLNPQVYEAFEQKLMIAHQLTIRFLEDYFGKFTTQKLHAVYSVMDRTEKEFVYVISTLLCSFYSKMITLEDSQIDDVKKGLRFLIKISRINEERIFKDILEFWKIFSRDLYAECPIARTKKRDSFAINEKHNILKVLRREKYQGILQSLIDLIICKMPRPEEVFVMENEYGEVVKERMVESDQIEFYKNMKETFFYLCFLDKAYSIETINSKLRKLFQTDNFSWDLVNRVSWSAGCVAGALDESEESNFFVCVLKELLTLCEIKYSKPDKAIIASNIMFLIGQFDRFLLANNKFLKTVVKKLFEFMGETHEGIQDMACDTFLKITEKCSKIFMTQMENNENLCFYILKNLNSTTATLEYYQRRIVYEAMCRIIAFAPDSHKFQYIQLLLNCFNSDLKTFDTKEKLKEVCHSLRSCSIVFTVLPQSINMLVAMQEVFIGTFEHLVENKAPKYEIVSNEILSLFTNILRQGRVVEININLIHALLERILINFKVNVDSHFLALASEIVTNVETLNLFQRDSFFISNIFEPLHNVKLQNAELKLQYFVLLNSLVVNSFDSFVSICWVKDDLFSYIYQNVLEGLSDVKEVNELSLNILGSFLRNMSDKRNFPFFIKFTALTLENMMSIIFDKDMEFSYEKQCEVLSLFFQVIKDPNMIRIGGTDIDNITFIHSFITALFSSNFPNLSAESIHLFSVGLFDLSDDAEILKDHVSDFRIKMSEFYGNDDLEDEIKLANERKELLAARSGSFK